jgi:hypothetical protein
MAGLTLAVGRPMVHDLRAMCDSVAYVVKNGVERVGCGAHAIAGGRDHRRGVESPARGFPDGKP